MHIAKNLKVMEWLKAEIIERVGGLFKGLFHGNESYIIDSMAGLLIAVYVLARRIGIPFHQIDSAVMEKLHNHQKEGHEIEEWYGDLSILEQYMKKR
ncbi:hypothetical protein U473_12615 [Tepidibacillus decaturensis]|uniref:MazG-like family protein n=2 Tax=Bacillaceae TaxID=186817 RepID=A0A135L6Y6_9BACI|nr:hypothetical protein U473_12615 [Tepidibacillus decaturensis]